MSLHGKQALWRDDWCLSGFREHPQDRLDGRAQEIKTVPNRLLFSRASLIERYVVGDVAFHCHFAIRAIQLDAPARQFCAVFNWPVSSDLAALDPHTASRAEAEVTHAQNCACGVEEAVLVGVGEFLKGPKRVNRRVLPVVKRLDALHNCERVGPETSGFPATAWSFGAFKARAVFEDGELGSIGWVPVQGTERVDGVVESGAQVVDDFTDDDAPLGRGLTLDMDEASLLSRIALCVKREGVRAIFKPPLDGRLESVRVLICAVNLEVGALQ